MVAESKGTPTLVLAFEKTSKHSMLTLGMSVITKSKLRAAMVTFGIDLPSTTTVQNTFGLPNKLSSVAAHLTEKCLPRTKRFSIDDSFGL